MNKLIAFIGFVCGILTAIFALLLNPVGPVLISGSMDSNSYAWSALDFYGAELDEVTLLGLPLSISGKAFADEGVVSANASTLVLRGADNKPAALATRLVALDEKGELLSADLGVNSFTNIFWPNRGSLMLYGYENRWPVIRNNILSRLGRVSEDSWLVSAQSPGNSPTGVIGGSGAMEGMGGRYSETLQLNPEGEENFMGQLSLELSFK
ncbi:MAG: hypothetical protein GY727_07120 [Gammaproteobacteria bacterium]|nr:hypothetical protein [Gammaproteobacteria bacterium]MCP4091642.1 hypothetical protein [Gammaproteobacteria bacterium]MCP4276138.1 hypothetical protein [Gammaproteobacteria bacterium]MCP4831772.1 hypothetical protein [Gammaproteobacteria bacterium]MCP4929708.1 hypothetical protein [Gammaproteobacteria bacterium]